jgi:hypothetical protein
MDTESVVVESVVDVGSMVRSKSPLRLAPPLRWKGLFSEEGMACEECFQAGPQHPPWAGIESQSSAEAKRLVLACP